MTEDTTIPEPEFQEIADRLTLGALGVRWMRLPVVDGRESVRVLLTNYACITVYARTFAEALRQATEISLERADVLPPVLRPELAS